MGEGREPPPPPYITCNTWGCALINSFTVSVRQWDVLSKLALSPFRIKTRTHLEPPLWNPWSATDLLLDVSRFPFVIKSLIVYVQFSIFLIGPYIWKFNLKYVRLNKIILIHTVHFYLWDKPTRVSPSSGVSVEGLP